MKKIFFAFVFLFSITSCEVRHNVIDNNTHTPVKPFIIIDKFILQEKFSTNYSRYFYSCSKCTGLKRSYEVHNFSDEVNKYNVFDTLR